MDKEFEGCEFFAVKVDEVFDNFSAHVRFRVTDPEDSLKKAFCEYISSHPQVEDVVTIVPNLNNDNVGVPSIVIEFSSCAEGDYVQLTNLIKFCRKTFLSTNKLKTTLRKFIKNSYAFKYSDLRKEFCRKDAHTLVLQILYHLFFEGDGGYGDSVISVLTDCGVKIDQFPLDECDTIRKQIIFCYSEVAILPHIDYISPKPPVGCKSFLDILDEIHKDRSAENADLWTQYLRWSAYFKYLRLKKAYSARAIKYIKKHGHRDIWSVCSPRRLAQRLARRVIIKKQMKKR